MPEETLPMKLAGEGGVVGERLSRRLPRFIVMGERNSGTRLVEAFIRDNLFHLSSRNPEDYDPLYYIARSVNRLSLVQPHYRYLMIEAVSNIYYHPLSNKSIWKHAALPEDFVRYNEDRQFIAIAKDPLAWLVSLYKRPYHRDPRFVRRDEHFSDFIRTPWTTVARERSPKSFPNPVQLWNFKYRTYLNAARRFSNVHVVRYEQVIFRSDFLRDLVRRISGAPLPDAALPTYSTKFDRKTLSDYRRFYSRKEWFGSYASGDLAYARKELDEEVLSALGYADPASD